MYSAVKVSVFKAVFCAPKLYVQPAVSIRHQSDRCLSVKLGRPEDCIKYWTLAAQCISYTLKLLRLLTNKSYDKIKFKQHIALLSLCPRANDRLTRFMYKRGTLVEALSGM